jgi:hypothetical protein
MKMPTFASKYLIMYRLLIAFLIVLLPSIVFSQLTLTHTYHAPRAGDSVTFQSIRYMQPGEAGAEKIWDFSKIQDSGKSFVSHITQAGGSDLRTSGNDNIAITEDDNAFLYHISPDASIITAYTGERISLVYSDPMKTMQYPFAYGDQFRDGFVADVVKDGTMESRSDGEIRVVADAYGTLILPDRIIRNALRVKTERTHMDIGPCGLVERTHIRHQWYAPGQRYAVLSLISRESRYNGQERPVVMRSGYICTKQSEIAAGQDQALVEKTSATFSVVAWPNPFGGELNCYYFLENQMAVTAGLYDLSGKRLFEPFPGHLMESGLYKLNLGSAVAKLSPGVYYLRFSFDKEIVVKKVVKL